MSNIMHFEEYQGKARRFSASASLILVSLVGPLAAAAETANEFAVKGELRAGWLEYDYGNPNGDLSFNKGHKDSEGFYITLNVR